MKYKIPEIVYFVIFCLFISFFGLKSCMVTSWGTHEKPSTYSVHSVNGHEFSMIFLPDFEAIIWEKDPNNNFEEGVLTEIRGVYGTHYFGPIWQMQGPNSGGLFGGYRWLSQGQEPIHIEIIILDKFQEGDGKSKFGNVGMTFYTEIIKEKDRIKFQDIWLNKININLNMITILCTKFKKEPKYYNLVK